MSVIFTKILSFVNPDSSCTLTKSMGQPADPDEAALVRAGAKKRHHDADGN
jgi:hypothetical protein